MLGSTAEEEAGRETRDDGRGNRPDGTVVVDPGSVTSLAAGNRRPERSNGTPHDCGHRPDASVIADWVRRSRDYCAERDRPGRRIHFNGSGAMLLGVTATGRYAFATLPYGRGSGDGNGIVFLAGSHARLLLAASEPSGAAQYGAAARLTGCGSAENADEGTTPVPLRRHVLSCRF